MPSQPDFLSSISVTSKFCFLPELEEMMESDLDLKEPCRTKGHSVLHTH